MPSKNKILVLVIFFTIIFFVFILPSLDNMKQTECFDDKIQGMDTLKCHRDCCNYTQWTPLDPDIGSLAHDSKSEWVPSNFTCSQGASSGCPCVSKEYYKKLGNKFGNGGNCF